LLPQHHPRAGLRRELCFLFPPSHQSSLEAAYRMLCLPGLLAVWPSDTALTTPVKTSPQQTLQKRARLVQNRTMAELAAAPGHRSLRIFLPTRKIAFNHLSLLLPAIPRFRPPALDLVRLPELQPHSFRPLCLLLRHPTILPPSPLAIAHIHSSQLTSPPPNP
jgi:hypothetical protein